MVLSSLNRTCIYTLGLAFTLIQTSPSYSMFRVHPISDPALEQDGELRQDGNGLTRLALETPMGIYHLDFLDMEEPGNTLSPQAQEYSIPIVSDPHPQPRSNSALNPIILETPRSGLEIDREYWSNVENIYQRGIFCFGATGTALTVAGIVNPGVPLLSGALTSFVCMGASTCCACRARVKKGKIQRQILAIPRPEEMRR